MKTYVWRDGALYRPDGLLVGECTWEFAQECIDETNKAFPTIPDTKLVRR